MRLFFKVTFAFFFSLLFVELISFLLLCFIDLKNNGNFNNLLKNRLDDFNLSQKPIIIEYGDYDPIAQYWPIAESEYANTGLKYNSFGFLDNSNNPSKSRSFPKKEDDLFRIFLIGGSTALGVPAGGDRVDNSQTISSILETKLNNSSFSINGKRKFEVINFGMINGNSGNNLVRYTQYYLHLDPDMIITYNGFIDAFHGEKEGTPYINWNSNSIMLYFNSVTNKNLQDLQIKRLWWLPFSSSLINYFLKKNKTAININREADRQEIMEHHKKNLPIPHLASSYHYEMKKKQKKKSIFENNMRMFGSISCDYNIRMISVLQPILGWTYRDKLSELPIKAYRIDPEIYKDYIESFKDLNIHFKNCNAVSFYDSTDILQDNDYQPDGAHLNVSGNKKIADHLFNTITNKRE
jgi:hypothetical protein